MKVSRVIELNNTAVYVLQQGEYKQATDLLRAAIAGLKNCFIEHNNTEEVDLSESHSVNRKLDVPPSSSSASSSASFNDDEMADQKQGIIGVPLWTEESFAQKHDNSLIFVYAQALVLAPIDHHRKVLTGVILYNMALVNHARAIQKGKSGLLLAALKFYVMAVSIVQGQNDVADVKASSSLLLLALYNNMAQIYMSYSSSERMHQCLGSIECLLAADKIEEVIDIDDYTFFLTNSMLQLCVVAAPAA
jgi:hypothetical protein